MPDLTIYIDARTDERLKAAARELGRTVDDLASCAVSEAALDFARSTHQRTITSRRFGSEFDKPCNDPDVLECAKWECQVADCCQLPCVSDGSPKGEDRDSGLNRAAATARPDQREGDAP